MNTKDKSSIKNHVLRLLEENSGESISGAQAAAALSVSRAAVWKAIEELRREGYRISAVTNRGYCLAEGSDVLSPQGIGAHLRHRQLIPLLRTYSSLESTNLTAKQLAVAGAPHGTAVAASAQTAGRGRLGRSFFSPKDAGVYLSVILRPQPFDGAAPISGLRSTEDAMLMTTAASVAAARAIEAVSGRQVQIKWVNDLYLDGKKICGILTEGVTSFESGTIESIVIGIGINCFPPEGGLPEEIRRTAGCLFPEGPGRPHGSAAQDADHSRPQDSSAQDADRNRPHDSAAQHADHSRPHYSAAQDADRSRPQDSAAQDADRNRPQDSAAQDAPSQSCEPNRDACLEGAPSCFTKNALVAALLDQLMDIQEELSNSHFIDEYKRRSCVLGKEIDIIPVHLGISAEAARAAVSNAGPGDSNASSPETSGGGTAGPESSGGSEARQGSGRGGVQRAKAVDIDSLGRLIVELPDKTRRILSSGEISIRPAQG